ncbi:hypothetical protein BpHYR1_048166 [Brachionus plicatilis]|uniref:Uncharacterized protein n=1 Tax=Brachionus plicatilis TaxID=10195 RepID=A0A3M7QGG5_BRAPC|nr:hypothetical protein BpHYR1_048166 [Brachionus plicatilis]
MIKDIYFYSHNYVIFFIWNKFDISHFFHAFSKLRKNTPRRHNNYLERKLKKKSKDFETLVDFYVDSISDCSNSGSDGNGMFFYEASNN